MNAHLAPLAGSTRAARLDGLLMSRRLAVFANGSWLSSLPSICTILLLYGTFRDRVPGTAFGVWAAGSVALAIVRTLAIRPHTVAAMSAARMRAQWRLVNVVLALGALAFAAVFPLIAFYARDERLLVLGLTGATVYTSTLLMHRSAPAAARFHIVTVGTALMLASWFALGGAAAGLIALVALYGVALLGAVMVQERAFLSAASAEVDRAEAEETVRVLLYEFEEQAADWLWSVDECGQLRDVTPRFAEHLGMAAQALTGRRLLGLFRADEAQRTLAIHLAERTAFRDLVVTLRDGAERRLWRLSARPQADGGLRGVARDVTQDRLSEERIAYMAHFDSLTGLANRYLFNQRIAEALARDGARHVALFYLDLDDFKAVNDMRGHALGDRLLRAVAARLEQEVRPGDLVARLGGDQFAVLIAGEAGPDDLHERAQSLLASLREPFEIDGQALRLTTGIGIADCAEGGCDAQEMMRRADLALYAAKGEGRDRCALFTAALDSAARARRMLEADLREALRRDELRLHYQPIIDLDLAVTTGHEALLRWQHPARGLLPPGEFLHIAEETGLILAIGDWVVRQALAETAAWGGQGRIAINLSPTQIASPHFVAMVADAIARHDYPPERIEFEITEHVLLRADEAGRASLLDLRAMGVSIALDDFGTGYSSLSYLRRFPFDRIKIDRNFVEDIETGADSQAIVSSITRLADALGMETTAEGVERPEQLDMLRKLGCQEAQGYLVCAPVPAAELPAVTDNPPSAPSHSAAIIDYRLAREAVRRRRGDTGR